jgi:osmotically-inducible protein OsmY
MSDDQLVNDVNAELIWDPKVDAEAVAVSARDGVVTLRGTAGSFLEKRAAKAAAERVHGVKRVDNHLQVRLLDTAGRDDADLRGDVLQALVLDSQVPATVDARVEDGRVTLTGHAEWDYQRSEAARVAGNVQGVVDVRNDVTLTGANPDAHDVEESIRAAYARNAKLDAKALTVETDAGTVTLKGTVRSWAEHDEAVSAAWATAGVRHVKDHILVKY